MVKSDARLTVEVLMSPDYIGRTYYNDYEALPYVKDGLICLSDAEEYGQEELEHMKQCWSAYWGTSDAWWPIWLSQRKEWAKTPIDWSSMTRIKACTWEVWDRWWREDPQSLLDCSVRFDYPMEWLDSEETFSVYDFFFVEGFRTWKNTWLNQEPSLWKHGLGGRHPVLLMLPAYQKHLTVEDVHKAMNYFYPHVHNENSIYEWIMEYVEPITFAHYVFLRSLCDDINNQAKSVDFVKQEAPEFWQKCQTHWSASYDQLILLTDPNKSVWERSLDIVSSESICLNAHSPEEGVVWL